jgi:hypothetical protein
MTIGGVSGYFPARRTPHRRFANSSCPFPRCILSFTARRALPASARANYGMIKHRCFNG